MELRRSVRYTVGVAAGMAEVGRRFTDDRKLQRWCPPLPPSPPPPHLKIFKYLQAGRHERSRYFHDWCSAISTLSRILHQKLCIYTVWLLNFVIWSDGQLPILKRVQPSQRVKTMNSYAPKPISINIIFYSLQLISHHGSYASLCSSWCLHRPSWSVLRSVIVRWSISIDQHACVIRFPMGLIITPANLMQVYTFSDLSCNLN